MCTAGAMHERLADASVLCVGFFVGAIMQSDFEIRIPIWVVAIVLMLCVLAVMLLLAK
jgi:uncharacterized protein (DUF983 family)